MFAGQDSGSLTRCAGGSVVNELRLQPLPDVSPVDGVDVAEVTVVLKLDLSLDDLCPKKHSEKRCK